MDRRALGEGDARLAAAGSTLEVRSSTHEELPINARPLYEKLEVWRLAHHLALEAYRAAKAFPAEERYRLADQLARAAASIPTNIAEAEGRYQIGDQVHFLHIARGSLNETRYLFVLARDLGFLTPVQETTMNDKASLLHAKLHAFIASKLRLQEQKKAGIAPCRSSNVERRSSIAARSAAFTLIELLTVIAIIIVLAGLVVGISSYVNRSAIESRIRAEIKAMEAALEAYKADYGAYPPLDPKAFSGDTSSTEGIIDTAFASSVPKSNGWLNVHFVYRALAGVPGSGTPKTYMPFTSKQISTQLVNSVTYTVILDPNGNPYGYAPRGPVSVTNGATAYPLANPQTFDLWSAGVDGKSGYPTNRTSAVDDIGNWQR